jgi:hypothetical protein
MKPLKTSRDDTGTGTKINPKIQNKMLKNCKYCFSLNRKFYYDIGFFSNKKLVKCDDCGYTTKKHKTEYDAMVEWNKMVGK